MNGCSISTGISVQMVHACCVRLKGNSAYLREEELTESCSRGRAEPSEIMYMNKNSCLITDITAYLDIEISGNYEIFHVPRASACYMLSNDTVDRWWRGTLNENSYWSGHSSFSCDPFYIYMYIYTRARVRFMIKKGTADCRFDPRRDACIAKYAFYGGGVQF